MNDNSCECACKHEQNISDELLLTELGNLREQCPALKQVLIPDGIWEDFKQWDSDLTGNNPAAHRSMLLLAIKQKVLYDITSLIHRYILNNGKVRDGLNPGYLASLKEKWFKKSSSIKRHQKSKGYLGKLVELLVAQWLERSGWTIIDLEAWNKNSSDIIACQKNCQPQAFEVKYIGTDDDYFKSLLEHKLSGSHVTSSDLANNYIIFRIYEAFKQLKERQLKESKLNVVIVVVGITTSFSPIEFGNKFKHIGLQFCFEEAQVGDEWNSFYQDKALKKYPDIEKELPYIASDLNSIKIFEMYGGWKLEGPVEILPHIYKPQRT